MRFCAASLGTVLALGLGNSVLHAQERSVLRVERPAGSDLAIEIVRAQGHASVAAPDLAPAGFELAQSDGGWLLRMSGSPGVSVREASPYVWFGDELIQLVDAPYVMDGVVHVPVQLLVDVLPALIPERLMSVGPRSLRIVGSPAPRAPSTTGRRRPDAELAPGRPPTGRDDARRTVVVIDPGHGGSDPGAIGPGGVREKDVALDLAREVARALSAHAGVEVHLTRERDELVPLWQRGSRATELKGDRDGVFISIHANALPRKSVRGFETYFLSEARTEHERRVAANENAPLRDLPGAPAPDLDFILKELRNFDHQRWSALLAELVQDELDDVHPGPNRGVKQGPFAVITNALMPAVLVEIGFVTNSEEASLLASSAFHQDAARALVDAVLAFFERYPPSRPAVSGLMR